VTGSWAPVPDGSPFPLENLPYGVVSYPGSEGRHLVVAIGEHAVDLAAVAAFGLLDGLVDDPAAVFGAGSLNPLLAEGRATWRATRQRLQHLLSDGSHAAVVGPGLVPLSEVTHHLPFEVADYVDFYSSEQHARNVAEILFRDADDLPPSWRHLPIGYHGRAGTVVVGGTDVVRPCGQRRPRSATEPSFGPSRRLDVEVEVGFVVGTPTAIGSRVTAAELIDHVFGVVLVNDWSARDIQAWESTPLGPFLGKSFATSVSPWVVPLDALDAARVRGPEQVPPPMPYLRDDDPWSLDLDLELRVNGSVVSRPPFRTQYWTPGQQLAHLTANGAALRTGDLYASGTVTGPSRDQRGSLLELCWGGSQPVRLDDGTERTFLEDGDTVTITATAPGADGTRIGFGELTGTVRPATC
jgi:fumarylacetoacetase